MKNLNQIAQQLLGRVLKPADGYTLDDIRQTENRLGLTIPEVLRHFYLNIGRVAMLAYSFNRFHTLNELHIYDEKIIFLEENQGVCLWSTITSGDTVWVKYDNDDCWIVEPIELTKFVALMMYYNCAQGGFEFGGVSVKPNYTTILKYIHEKWHKAVEYNGLIIYAYQDNLIWYFYEDGYIPTDDGIYLSCRTYEKFVEINNSVGFNQCFDAL